MSGHSKARVYLRPLHPIKSNGPLPMVFTPIDVDLAAVSEILGRVTGRESIESQYFERLRDALIGMGYSHSDAQDLLARELGWPSFDSISNSCNVKPDKVFHALERRKNLRRSIATTARSAEVEQIKKLRRQETHLAFRGRYATMTAVEGQQYFFVDHPEYITILENLMKDHTDEWMEVAIQNYPHAPLGWDQFNKSFGTYWRKVRAFRLEQVGVFHAPGLEAVKRLATYLYSWNFRRYLTGPIILRHASYLTREFRANHIAIVRDKVGTLTVDEEYTYSSVDEEDGDDIGNRI